MWIGFNWLMQVSVAVSYENGNGPSGFTRGGKLFDQPVDHKFSSVELVI
jgi:hypothetical protein